MGKIKPENFNIERVELQCSERGYIFHGWVGDYQGNKTYLDLENPETGNRWKSTTLKHFLNGTGDPKIRGLSNKMEDNLHIKAFIDTGMFLEGVVFWRSTKKCKRGWNNYWDYTCPSCSNDEYVKAGVCDGIFTSYIGDLKNGVKSCRCSSCYRYTQNQRNYQINKICKEEGLTFVGWETKYDNNKSKFNWFYNDNETILHSTSVSDFLSGTRGGEYGFNTSRPASLYITRWYGYGESYLKFGITNREVIIRVNEQNSASKLDYEILYEFYNNSGSLIKDTERECMQSFSTGICPKKLLPDGYTETIEDTEENLNRLLHIICNNK